MEVWYVIFSLLSRILPSRSFLVFFFFPFDINPFRSAELMDFSVLLTPGARLSVCRLVTQGCFIFLLKTWLFLLLIWL